MREGKKEEGFFFFPLSGKEAPWEKKPISHKSIVREGGSFSANKNGGGGGGPAG